MPKLTCARCDLTFPYDLAKDVPCPTCNAPAGKNCRRPSGHPVWNGAGRLCIPRDQAALDAGALVRCPASHDLHDHFRATNEARLKGGFPCVPMVPETAPTGRYSPQRHEYASQTRARARQQERSKIPEAERRPSERSKPEPEVVAHAPSWMVEAMGMGRLVEAGLVVEEPSPGVTVVQVGKQLIPVSAKRGPVTLDSFT